MKENFFSFQEKNIAISTKLYLHVFHLMVSLWHNTTMSADYNMKYCVYFRRGISTMFYLWLTTLFFEIVPFGGQGGPGVFPPPLDETN